MPNDYRKSQSYVNWGTQNDYQFNPGTFVLPVAQTAEQAASCSPVVVVQAHAPYETRQLTFNAKKEGSPPVIPAPASSGCFILLGGAITVPGPSINQNGTKFNWEVGGTYTYVQTLRSDKLEENGLVLSGFPFSLDIQDRNKIEFQGQAVPNRGPVPSASFDVRAGYAQGKAVTLSDPYWSYTNPAYLPAVFMDSQIANGGNADG